MIYRHTSGAETELSAFIVDYDFSLFSNFTYLLDDPVNGDEFEQLDSRTYYGAAVTHERDWNDRLNLRLGAETRLDDISDIGLFKTQGRQRASTVRPRPRG